MENTRKSVAQLLQDSRDGKKGFAFLVDPDKSSPEYLIKAMHLANEARARFIFVGGSLVMHSLEPVFDQLRDLTDIPLVSFPGSAFQVCSKADAILFLSLISGRNPEYLIGNHVVAAPFIQKYGIEAVPTGYMLISGGQTTAVEYVSQTMPIPAHKSEIAVATAMAGELLGLKAIYMDAGSGAKNPVPDHVIESVARNTNGPLIIGGGIRSKEQAIRAFKAGASIVVVGNKVEENPDFLTEIQMAVQEVNE